MRTYVKLVCTECNEENYYTDKNKRTAPDRLEMKNIALNKENTLYIGKNAKTIF